jgi:hypothetical protein
MSARGLAGPETTGAFSRTTWSPSLITAQVDERTSPPVVISVAAEVSSDSSAVILDVRRAILP